MKNVHDDGSFRDPSGFVFNRGGSLYRQVQELYRQNYDLLISSGLYRKLTDANLLIPHEERSFEEHVPKNAYRLLQPEPISFISYPYEWCFSQLKDAALATLRIQEEALGSGMSLKDANAYNIQFHRGKPILIDTLSFEIYQEGAPWAAYRQFCQHFLAPLALMSLTDTRLSQLLRVNLDGIPLDLASCLLPKSSWLSPGLLAHIHLHGKAQKNFEDKQVKRPDNASGVSRTAHLGLLDNLTGVINGLKWKPSGTTWAEYYQQTNYSDNAMQGKKQLVSEMLAAVNPKPKTVWDLGANTGVFSRLSSEIGAETVAWDIDPGAVEKHYLECRSSGQSSILPLLQDLANPSPDLGWALRERRSLVKRGPANMAFALALVHHLAIGNNVPLGKIAQFMSECSESLIIEFVPKSDSQVKRLLSSREDIFPNYTLSGFESEFKQFFDIVRQAEVPDSERTIYLMKAK